MNRDRTSLLPCGYLSFGDDNIIREVNDEANRLLGFEGAELVGQRLKVLLPPATRMLAYAHIFPRLAVEGRADELYVALRTRSGADLNCLMNVGRRTEAGEPVNELVFMLMNRRHYFERELENAREGALQARRAEVNALQRLEEIESRLVSSDRLVALGTLAAGIAHEVNNPLFYIGCNLSTVEREVRDLVPQSGAAADVFEAIAEAQLGVDRIREIVASLKGFSRVDATHRVPVDVAKVIHTAERMVQHEVKHHARLDTGCETPAPMVWGDEGQLVQVLVNLVINACQAFPPGIGTHRICIRAHATHGQVEIEVSDNGPGVPAAIRSRIFEPFFTTKPIGVGTGLGLSVCHGIVTSLGGVLSLDAAKSPGATFRVHLPMANVAVAV